jgi:hypothetical protein
VKNHQYLWLLMLRREPDRDAVYKEQHLVNAASPLGRPSLVRGMQRSFAKFALAGPLCIQEDEETW